MKDAVLLADKIDHRLKQAQQDQGQPGLPKVQPLSRVVSGVGRGETNLR